MLTIAEARARPRVYFGGHGTLSPMGAKTLTYAAAGVDIDAGERVVDLIRRAMRATYGPRVLGRHGGFAGCFRLDYNERLFQRNYRDPVLISCADGVGSKVSLAARLDIYETIGQDLVAMNVNDLVVQGAEPLFLLDYIGIHKVDPPLVARIVKGVADACQMARCALLGGETAELPDIYKPGDFDLAGFAVGVCELDRLVDGSRAQENDVVIGLASSGVHSNGFTLVRAIVEGSKLDLDRIYPQIDEAKTLGQTLLMPTRIYAPAIVSVVNAYRVKRPIRAMSHITGGGLPGNVTRTLGSHLNARIQRSTWRVPPVFEFLGRHGPVPDEEMWRAFNMGIGYVCIVRPHFAEAVMRKLRRAGEQPMAIGRVVPGTGRLQLV